MPDRFKAELLKTRNALHLKDGTQQYYKVFNRIGRLIEKYKLMSHAKVAFEKDTVTGKTKNVTWSDKKTEKTGGIYCLKTDRKNLN